MWALRLRSPGPCHSRGHTRLPLPPCRTPLHCAASCNSVHLCKQLVESGAAIFASTISDIETAADKCEEMEEGYIQCSQFLYGTRVLPNCRGLRWAGRPGPDSRGGRLAQQTKPHPSAPS